MTEPAIWHSTAHPMTRAERDALPPDGRRHELIHGTLVMTPAPSMWHQRGVMQLGSRLLRASPRSFEVFSAPVDVVLLDDTILQPDVVVVRRTDPPPRNVSGAPLLAIEVLSPSTRHIDRGAKKLIYAEAGCPSYWIVDPDEPSVVGYRLAEDGDGEYVEFARAVGDELFEATEPFSVAFTPAELFS